MSTSYSHQWFPAHIQKHDGKSFGYQRRFAEFSENEKYHVSYILILVANIFSDYFCHFDEVSVLKSNSLTYLIRNFETVSLKLLRITSKRILSFYALKGLGLFGVWT